MPPSLHWTPTLTATSPLPSRDRVHLRLADSTVKRIDDVKMMRNMQFEDSGPMSHPIRPEQYVKMDNFYTRTVYIKVSLDSQSLPVVCFYVPTPTHRWTCIGAEVIRMYETLVSREGFRKGVDLYFGNGRAVTCEEFRMAIADANGEEGEVLKSDEFARWYSQSGTPTLVVEETEYDDTVTLVSQNNRQLGATCASARARPPHLANRRSYRS